MKKLQEATRQGCPDLSLEQRQEIFRLRAAGYSMREVAEVVDCAKSSVWETINHKSLKRRHPRLPWYVQGKIVHDAVRQNRGRPRERSWGLKNEAMRQYVIEKLKDKLSPMSISIQIEKDRPGLSISHESVYQYIYKIDRTLLHYLTRHGKTKRNKRASGQSSRQKAAEVEKRWIDQRMHAANNRLELGHLESDFIVSAKKGKSCLLVAVDRKARRIRLRKTVNREADTTRRTLFNIFRDLPQQIRKSLTVDNDPAHNDLPLLEPIFPEEALRVFFCIPYSAWQRGTVEAIIGILRRWFPKGTNFDDVSEQQIQYVEDWFNNRPMEVLNGKTPNEVFELELKKVA